MLKTFMTAIVLNWCSWALFIEQRRTNDASGTYDTLLRLHNRAAFNPWQQSLHLFRD